VSRRPGRRGFAAALFVLVGLSALAIGTRAGGKSDDSTDTRAAQSALEDRQELGRLKGALMPLLQYVREGQPRDALKELSGGSGSAVGPAVMRSIHDGATSALVNLDQLDQTTVRSGRSLRLIKAATSLYAEAAGLAADASDGAPAGSRIALATMGDHLLRFADALFDQARRLGQAGLIPASAVRIDPPEAVPDIGPPPGLEGEPTPAVPKSRKSAVSLGTRCLGLKVDGTSSGACSEGPGLAMAAAAALHGEGDRSEQAAGREIAFRVWAEAQQLAVTLAKPGEARGDLDRPRRLRALAQTILKVDGSR
jgi:hypothetical protein